MRRPAALAIAILALLLCGGEAAARPPVSATLFHRRAGADPATPPRGGVSVTVDRDALRGFRLAGGGRLTLPLADGTDLAVVLERFDVLAPGAVVTLTGRRGPVSYRPDLTLFQGRVEGEPGSLAVFAMSSGRVTGRIRRDSGWLLVAPLTPDATAAEPGAGHVIVPETDLPAPPEAAFDCPSDALTLAAEPVPAGLPLLPADIAMTTTRLVCDVALDCDHDFFVKEGSDSARAVTYALVMLGTSSVIYEREINVALRASYLNLWTTSSDPYGATNLSAQLDEFATYWKNNRSDVTRGLAQLVSGRSLGGGIAWIGSLCSTRYGYSVISNLTGSNIYPTNVTTWDINVMAHELGHNFNSRHTHSCWWQSNGYAPAGALLDSCYTAEGSCYAGGVGITPPDLGTIMSYCHLLGGEDHIRLDFHAACRTVMRYAAESAACLAAAVVQPPTDLAVAADSAGAHLSWTASVSPDVLRYDVFRSPWQQDLDPDGIGETSGTSFTDLALGTYWYKVRAVRAADSSAFSGEVRGTACSLAAPVAYGVGASPLSSHAADFDEDGILDLAVPALTGHRVSILLGQGDGTFAAAVGYALPAGSYPAALVSADFDADGILDLAVADEGGSAVSILRGGGSDGVGDGTFAAPVQYGVSATPWGIVAGDFDADGITDLATAGAGSYVSVLIGNGTAGTGDGAFAAAVDYAIGSAGSGLTTGDFDADGITDLAVTANAGVVILRGLGADGHGDGTFAAPTTYACETYPQAVATGDFDADGITDLAVANAGSNSVSVLLGHGTGGGGDGTFAAAVPHAAGLAPYAVATGDWNGDGATDLAVANGSSAATVSILAGQRTGGVPDGTFGAPQAFAAGTWARGVTAGDFDGDGMADLAVANKVNAGTVSVLLAGCTSPLPGTLAVTAPAGGELWLTGTRQIISWSRGSGILAVDVALSRDGGVNWQTLARGVTDTCWTWNVAGALARQARIRVTDPAVPAHAAMSDSDFTVFPAALVDADAPAPAGFALRSVEPNPARGAVRVSFALPGAGAGRLELLDLAGRCMRSLELRGTGTGTRSVDLDGLGELRPGLYLARLSQAGQCATRKFVVLR
jgi:hypothetical protein